jgi:iron complex outermembrane receptor protein
MALLGAASFSGVGYAARTAEAADFLDLSPEQLLSAEVVSVSKRAESVAEAPAAVYVVTAEDIARAGITALPDALRMVPGVDVAQGDANSWAINIRGFNKGLANQLLVMIDGRTIYTPLFAGTYWELQNMPLENIERIEVVRGPGGTLWGANAVNGVINIITKKAGDTQGNLVSAGFGNYLEDSILGQTGGKIGEDAFYRVYAQHLNNGSFDTPQGRDAGDTRHDTRAGFRFDRGESFTLSGDVYVNGSDQLVSIPQLTSPYAVVHPDEMKSRGANILAHWNTAFADGSALSLQAYADYTRREQYILDDEEDILDLDAQYNFAPRGAHEFTIGGGYRLSHQDIENTPTLSFYPETDTYNLFNLFVQDKIALIPESLYLTLGSKAEHNDFTGFEFEPNARLQWFPDGRQTIWASASKAVRTPSPLERTIDEIAGDFPPTAGFPLPVEYELVGNGDFQSERLIAYEMGYRNQVAPNISMDLAAFYNDYNGLAAQELVSLAGVPAGAPTYAVLMTTQDNLMSAETYGIEIAADWNVTPDWKLSGGYSLLKMALHLDNDFTGQQAQEDQSPQQMANIRSYWNIDRQWTLDTAVYYVDRLKAFDVPSYVRLDLNLGWRMNDNVQFNLIGQNLLEDSHREFGQAADLTATEIPRTVFGKITWRF